MPELSVIVPVYKVEKYIRECVDSILASTFSDFVLYLVDDGSPDSCGEICDEYAKNDTRVRVIHKTNGGLSSARNAALDVVSTEIVAFVDSDDRIHSDMFEKMISVMKSENADIVCCGMPLLTYDNSETPFIGWPEEDKTYVGADCLELLFAENGTGDFYMNKIYKTSLFSDIRMPVGKIYEDVYTMHRVFERSKKTVFLADGLYDYRINQEGISHSKKLSPKIMDYVYAAKGQFEFIKEKYPKFYNPAFKKYKKAIIQVAKRLASEKSDFAKENLAACRKLLVEVKTDIEKCDCDYWAKTLIDSQKKFVSRCRLTNFYNKQHNHPKYQKIIGKIFNIRGI